MLKYDDKNNKVEISPKVNVHGSIRGKNNIIYIGDFLCGANITLNIYGDNNKIFIDSSAYTILELIVDVGNFSPANNTNLIIGKNFQCGKTRIYLYNPRNSLYIGENCMLSTNITIRCGELPHLLFDKRTKEFIDTSTKLKIGNHCWIGENVYITKNASIPSESIVAANSVVTKRFTTKHCVFAGNPANQTKKNVVWIKGMGHLDKNEDYFKNFKKYYKSNSQFQEESFDSIDDFIRKCKTTLRFNIN